MNDESGNPIWKNRVESWKDKKNKKKKAPTKAEIKAKKEDEIPPEQQMEEKQYVQISFISTVNICEQRKTEQSLVSS